MTDELKKIELILIKAGIEPSIFFNQGLDRASILCGFTEIGLVPTEALIQLFQWHNGVNYKEQPSGKVSFTYMGIYFPLEDCLESYKEITSYYGNYFSFFPFFSSEDILIDLGKGSKTYGQLFLISPSQLIVEPTTIYDSLETMIQCTIKSFERGLLWYDENGFLEMEYSEISKLSKELNPNSEYWKL